MKRSQLRFIAAETIDNPSVLERVVRECPTIDPAADTETFNQRCTSYREYLINLLIWLDYFNDHPEKPLIHYNPVFHLTSSE